MNEILIAIILFLTLFGFFRLIEVLVDVFHIVDSSEKQKRRRGILEFLANGKYTWLKFSVVFFTCFIIGPYCVHHLGIPKFISSYKPSKTEETDTKSTQLEPNAIGDAFGGTTGPFVAFLGVILTYLAFYVQYQANEKQQKTWRLERFESKFYEMLRIHKENVSEMKIGKKIEGRDCFYHMFQELVALYFVDKNSIGIETETKENLEFTYEIFFNGFDICYSKAKINTEKDKIGKFQGIVKNNASANFNSYQNDKTITFHIPSSNKYEYYTFQNLPILSGNNNRLEHYYRHLYLIVKFVEEKSDEDSKQEYFDLIRAQLSKFEQLLMYYNAIAWFPDKWYKYFVDYRLIKNIPIALADMEPKPQEYFAEEIEQWEEKGEPMFNDIPVELKK